MKRHGYYEQNRMCYKGGFAITIGTMLLNRILLGDGNKLTLLEARHYLDFTKQQLNHHIKTKSALLEELGITINKTEYRHFFELDVNVFCNYLMDVMKNVED